ncbi:MAG: DUF4270 family protein [Bacteroidales bacterium]|nr:DUF4270 family protein [Candidatus Liminaster caballi]
MKNIGYTVIAAISMLIMSASCSDELSKIGSSVRPNSDGITIKSQSFDIEVGTSYRDSIYVRTGYPLLGKITDPEFGEISAGYLAQFYANKETGLDIVNQYDSTTFNILKTSVPKTMGYDWPDFHYEAWDSLVNNRIDSMTIRIFYNTYYGDSLTPMQISVYSLNPDVEFETLPESEFYSNNDFNELYDIKNIVGRKGFTAANREVSDSIRGTSDYMNYIEVKLSDTLKEKFFRLCVEAAIARDKNNPHHTEYNDIFADQKLLRENWLSGVCVKPTFGDGSLIKVYYTAIYFFYSSHHRYAPDGTLLRNDHDDADSSYVSTHVKYVAVTPDVIQMSGLQFTDDNKESRLSADNEAYISSPQGYYATIDLPVGKIIGTMMNDPQRNDSSYFLNSANFYLKSYKPEGYMLSKTPAPTVLMVQQDSIYSFFEEGLLPNSKTSCYAQYVCDSVPNSHYNNPDEGVYYYKFGNISTVVRSLAENEGWKKSMSVSEWENQLRSNNKITGSQTIDDYMVRMAVIPVDVTTNSSSGSILSVSNYILPTSVTLQKGDGKQSIQMVYTLEGTKD